MYVCTVHVHRTAQWLKITIAQLDFCLLYDINVRKHEFVLSGIEKKAW